MSVMKFLCVLVMSVFAVTGVLAQDVGRNTVLFGDDIDFVDVRDAYQCSRECEQDGQCKAWTFVKQTGQCRLKASVLRSAASSCCDSGVVQRSSQRPGDYSPAVRVTQCTFTFRRNGDGWRERRWRRGDCSNGLPPAGALAIGQAQNGNGTGGQADCTAVGGRHYNHPSLHGTTTGTVICLYISG